MQLKETKAREKELGLRLRREIAQLATGVQGLEGSRLIHEELKELWKRQQRLIGEIALCPRDEVLATPDTVQIPRAIKLG